MSETVAIPNYDRPNSGSLQGIIAQALSVFKRNLDNCLPATVIAYDRASNRASVQPQIQMVTTLGEAVARKPIASVPVFTSGGGGFFVSFPLVSGAKGWIKANDRDISLYLQSGNETTPNIPRMHSFSDAVFYPDITDGLTVADEDGNACVIQSTDGTIKIALGVDGGIKIATPGGTFEMKNDRIVATTPLFQVSSALIEFTTNPVIGPLT